MYRIINKKNIAENIISVEIEAPAIAAARKPGQFVLVMADTKGERVPFTIMDADTDKGTITLVIQVVGTTTKKINNMKIGDKFHAVVGPLGNATEIKKYGTVVCIGGGVGTAVVYPITKALKECGNRIISIIGARNKDYIILEHEMRNVSDEIFFTTDDGSYGTKGFVTDELKKLMSIEKKPDLAIAIGPPIMMKNVVDVTKANNIPTIVSLNSIMIDGTGMCGGCRVIIDRKTKFVCTDGPEFDGFAVDFDNLIKRLKTFHKHEKCSLDRYIEKE